MAYKETDEIKDWRLVKMMEVQHRYFHDLWSNGNLDVCDEILDDSFVHREHVWHPQELIIGPAAMKSFVAEIRAAYPDFNIEVEQVGASDGAHTFVQWSGTGTNLGQRQGHSASYHESHVSGITLVSFTSDRSKITSVDIYRQPMHEEFEEIEARTRQYDPLEIKLERLHFDSSNGTS